MKLADLVNYHFFKYENIKLKFLMILILNKYFH